MNAGRRWELTGPDWDSAAISGHRLGDGDSERILQDPRDIWCHGPTARIRIANWNLLLAIDENEWWETAYLEPAWVRYGNESRTRESDVEVALHLICMWRCPEWEERINNGDSGASLELAIELVFQIKREEEVENQSRSSHHLISRSEMLYSYYC